MFGKTKPTSTELFHHTVNTYMHFRKNISVYKHLSFKKVMVHFVNSFLVYI